jgi:hypothetical protein
MWRPGESPNNLVRDEGRTVGRGNNSTNVVIFDDRQRTDGRRVFLMLRTPVTRFCQELLALPIRGLVRLVQQFSRWAVSKGRQVHEENMPLWKQIRPQSRVLKDPPGERALVPPLQARWLARILVASRPLGP